MSRALVVLAIRTSIPPDVWERQADGAIETAIEILREQDAADEAERGKPDGDAQMSG